MDPDDTGLAPVRRFERECPGGRPDREVHRIPHPVRRRHVRNDAGEHLATFGDEAASLIDASRPHLGEGVEAQHVRLITGG